MKLTKLLAHGIMCSNNVLIQPLTNVPKKKKKKETARRYWTGLILLDFFYQWLHGFDPNVSP